MSIVTISRQIGAGGSEVARRLAEILGYECLDKELLHQDAQLSGIAEPELYRLDESAPSLWERVASVEATAGYFRALGQFMRAVSERDRVILVGRGGNLFLRDSPRAYHARIVADAPTRIRRICAKRWVSEEPAHRILQETDRRREAFVRHFFGTSADDPLLYHAVYNTSLLDPETVALLIAATVLQLEEMARAGEAAAEGDQTPT